MNIFYDVAELLPLLEPYNPEADLAMKEALDMIIKLLMKLLTKLSTDC
jgi:hypothetical protein